MYIVYMYVRGQKSVKDESNRLEKSSGSWRQHNADGVLWCVCDCVLSTAYFPSNYKVLQGI